MAFGLVPLLHIDVGGVSAAVEPEWLGNEVVLPMAIPEVWVVAGFQTLGSWIIIAVKNDLNVLQGLEPTFMANVK